MVAAAAAEQGPHTVALRGIFTVPSKEVVVGEAEGVEVAGEGNGGEVVTKGRREWVIGWAAPYKATRSPRLPLPPP